MYIMKVKWPEFSKKDLIINLIFGSVGLICLLWACYLDYPDFDGFKLMWTSFKSFFGSIAFIIIGLISLSFGLVIYFLAERQSKRVMSIKPGDKIIYNGCRGVFKSSNNTSCIIEIEVPLMSLSKEK